MIHLKAALRLYEMYYGKDCLYTMNTENQMTKEEKEAIALLNTPIENLGFEVRASRVLCEQGIQTPGFIRINLQIWMEQTDKNS